MADLLGRSIRVVRDGSHPVADLSAGAGPENPPCPACGEPLFGWAKIRPKGAPVRRCERCGMAVVGGPATREEAVAALEELRGGTTPNRASAAAWLGSSGWSGLNRESRFLFTADAVERLGGATDRPGPDYVGMWMTILNSFTFGHNFVPVGTDRGPSTPAEAAWQRAIDWVIVFATFPPLALIAGLVESIAWAAGGGGSLPIRK
jgi:ribosomal protein L34E